MKLLQKETEKLQRAGADVNLALRVYHPIVNLQAIILYCVGNEAVKQSTQTYQTFKRPQLDPFGKFRNHVNEVEVDVDTASTRPDSPDLSQSPDLIDLDIQACEEGDQDSSAEQKMLEYYHALHDEIAQVESLALEKKFKSFPNVKAKDPAKSADQEAQGARACYNCGSTSHFIAACPKKSKRPSKFRSFKPKPKPEAAPTDLLGELTLEDLNNFTFA